MGPVCTAPPALHPSDRLRMIDRAGTVETTEG
jgi:hypothetical protein